jgi:hypothetical protein
MLMGPDGKPIQTTPVLGSPKLEDMPILTAEQMVQIAEPIREALAAGVHPQSPCNVEFGMMAQLVNTVMSLQTPLPALLRPGAEEE